MKKDKEEVFFVGVQDPIEIRRTLLESSKEMLQILQRYEKFKEVRKEKHAAIAHLKEDLKNIQALFARFKKRLPTTHLRLLLQKEQAKVEKPAKVKKGVKKGSKEKVLKTQKEKAKVKLIKKEMSDLEKLESELAAIEGKLGSLI